MNHDLKSLAVATCFEKKASLTPQRFLILETMERQKRPVSAYEVRDILVEAGNSFNIATIYRVLGFWCSHRLVHRLAALNKYICCAAPEEKHTHIINCCQKCQSTYESCNKQMGIDLDRGPESLGLIYAANNHLEIPVICISCR